MAQHIIANIAWQEDYWTGKPTQEEMDAAGFKYVEGGHPGHEYLNFSLDHNVENGYKIGYFQMRGRPRGFSNGVGCVFFSSKGFIVGVYGRAEIGDFSMAESPSDDHSANVRAPVEYVCRFDNIRSLELDKGRHLAGQKSFRSIAKIGDTEAKAILDDAIAAHQPGSEYLQKLKTIRAFLDEAPPQKIWKIAPGEGASIWPECLTRGCIAIGWDALGDLREYDTEEEILQALGQHYKQSTINRDSLWNFVHQVSEGDIVVANKGRTEVAGIGLVTGDYQHLPADSGGIPEHANIRPARWMIRQSVNIPFNFKIPTVVSVSTDQWTQIKAAYLAQDPSLAHVFDELEGKIVDPEIRETFSRTRNVILYGPPGTGKTYRAVKFAQAWTGEQIGKDRKSHRHYWCVVANPKEWKWDELFGKKETETYRRGRLKRNYQGIQVGDLVFGYTANPDKQLCCLAEVTAVSEIPNEEIGFEMRGVQKLAYPITWQQLRDDMLLQQSEPVRFRMQGTLFRLEPDEARYLREMIETQEPNLSEVFDKYFESDSAEYVRTVTFHQSYGYEDFVEGLRPIPDPEGRILYEWRPGIFKQLCDDAAAEPENRFILIIDEVNRGNIAKILGELITLLEDDKRIGQDNEMTTILPGSRQRFGVPDNVYLLGTMNTADRSIALLDVALRRRFTFLPVRPDASLLNTKTIEGIKLDKLLQRLNDRIEALLDRDHCLGHSYFLGVDSLEALHFVWYQRIIPLLEEYFFNDGERLRAVLDDFISLEGTNGNVFSRLPDTFDPDRMIPKVVPMAGQSFAETLRKLVGGTEQ